jgi:hypothetical protein
MTPSHYSHEIEPIAVMEMVAENTNVPAKVRLNVAQAIKYLLRLGYKGSNYLEDLDKAIDYLWRARHGEWCPTGEMDTPEKQMCRIRNLFRLSDEWYTAEDVMELLLIPIDSVYDMLGDLADAAGYLEREANYRGTPVYRRLRPWTACGEDK